MLLDSSKRGDCGKLCLAIENGADPCIRDEEGCTALHYAVRHSHYDVIDSLLKHSKSGFILSLLYLNVSQRSLSSVLFLVAIVVI